MWQRKKKLSKKQFGVRRKREWQTAIHSLSRRFKTRAALWGLALLLLAKPSQSTNGGKEGNCEVWIGVRDQTGAYIQAYSV